MSNTEKGVVEAKSNKPSNTKDCTQNINEDSAPTGEEENAHQLSAWMTVAHISSHEQTVEGITEADRMMGLQYQQNLDLVQLHCASTDTTLLLNHTTTQNSQGAVQSIGLHHLNAQPNHAQVIQINQVFPQSDLPLDLGHKALRSSIDTLRDALPAVTEMSDSALMTLLVKLGLTAIPSSRQFMGKMVASTDLEVVFDAVELVLSGKMDPGMFGTINGIGDENTIVSGIQLAQFDITSGSAAAVAAAVHSAKHPVISTNVAGHIDSTADPHHIEPCDHPIEPPAKKRKLGMRLLVNAGMRGFLAGEPPKGYTSSSATSLLLPYIGPRYNFQLLGHDLAVVMADGSAPIHNQIGSESSPTRNCLSQGGSARAGVASVLAHRKAMASADNRNLVLMAIGPGVENAICSHLGLYLQNGALHKFREGPKAKDKRWSELPDLEESHHVRGFVFLTPIVVEKKQFEEKRSLALLQLPEGAEVLIVTGSEDKENLKGIRDVMERMRCQVQLYVVEGADHNPFDSKPRKKDLIEQKNKKTRAVIEQFLNRISA